MEDKKKIFEELYKGNRSFSVISSVLSYFYHPKTEKSIENIQKEEWYSIVENDNLPTAELKHVLYQIKYRILLEKSNHQRRLFIRLSQIAAVVFILLLMQFFFIKPFNTSTEPDSQSSLIELYSPGGARTKFLLPDGSSGWMAGGTVLTYGSDFNNSRNVSVEGEAYFNVKHDEKHPFTVKLNDLNIRVLGTKFNVLNYSDKPISEIVVLSGLVEVTENTKEFKELLGSNRMLKFQMEEKKIYLTDVDAHSYTAWTEGRLEFNNEPLESVCSKIERYYDVDVELNIKGLKNNLFRANVKIGRLEELLKYMSIALPIKYELEDAKESADGKILQRKLIISKK